MNKLFEYDEHIGDWRVLVQSRDIQNGAIQSRHITNNAVTTEKIGNGEIHTNNIAPGAVTTEKIGNGEIHTNNIAPGAVTEDKIAEDAVDDIRNLFLDLLDNYRPITINGDVTNAPDEEDITSEDGLLKLKNRPAGLYSHGYKILRRDKSFAEQVNLIDTIYEIRYDFDLNGETVTIPDNCILKFEGGSIKNGAINAPSLQNEYLNITDFGINETDDCYQMLSSLINNTPCDIYIPKGEFKVSQTVVITASDKKIYGTGVIGESVISSDNDVTLFFLNSCDKLTVKGISFVGTGKGYPYQDRTTFAGQYLFVLGRDYGDISNTNISVSNCHFEKATGGIFLHKGTDGIYISKCHFEDMRTVAREPGDIREVGQSGGYGVVCHFNKDLYSPTFNFGVKNIVVDDCVFESTVRRHALYIQNVHHGVFTNNLMKDKTSEILNGYESHIMHYMGKNVRYSCNTLYGGLSAITISRHGLPVGYESYDYAENVVFENNYIYDYKIRRISNAGIEIKFCNNSIVRNNVISTRYAAKAINFAEISNVSFIDNIMKIGDEATEDMYGTVKYDDSIMYCVENNGCDNVLIKDNRFSAVRAYNIPIHFRFINQNREEERGINGVTIQDNHFSETCAFGLRITDSCKIAGLRICGNMLKTSGIPVCIKNIDAYTTEGDVPVYAEDVHIHNNIFNNNVDIQKGLDYTAENNLPITNTRPLNYAKGRSIYPVRKSIGEDAVLPDVSFRPGDVLINYNSRRGGTPALWHCFNGGDRETARFSAVCGNMFGTTEDRESYNFADAPSDHTCGVMFFDTDLNKPLWYNSRESRWEDAKGFAAARSSGSTENRPVGLHNEGTEEDPVWVGLLKSPIDLGFEYYDTTISKPIYASAIDSETGEVTWVDALGNAL